MSAPIETPILALGREHARIEQEQTEIEAECERIERALASAIRVLLEVPGVLADGLRRDDYAGFPENKWKGAMPAVRVGDPLVRRCVPRMDGS